MDGEASLLFHPFLDLLVLKGAVIDHDRIQFPVRVFAIEMFGKTQEFLVRVPVYAPVLDAALMN
jgi:hypothetical protein